LEDFLLACLMSGLAEAGHDAVAHRHEYDAHLAALCCSCRSAVDADAQAMETMMVVFVGCFFATMVVAGNLGVVD
jgi:hypothetical protein